MGVSTVICPGCGIDLPLDNNGCNNCDWQWVFGENEDAPFRIPPVLEIALEQETSVLDNVSPLFLFRIISGV